MTTLQAGFADPVFNAQAAFKVVMDAMARPGLPKTIPALLNPPAGLPPTAAAVALALMDFETPFWLSPSLRQSTDIADYIRFHTDAVLVDNAAHAAFAVVDLHHDSLDLSSFAQGTPEYPDRSTTVIVLCEAVADGTEMGITGPGVKGTGQVAFRPVPSDFVAQWRSNRGTFPLGIDLILTAVTEVVCLPRSVRLTGEAA